ncbi:hypothetical protein ACJZL1_05725 [Wolbachia endosymbiont of Rhagoletis indifferens]|uniref:hypothetical protein n=1 Tax=Wolbachia endosymbiont of Rhagoletis indifferens TaxID=3383250 RepID=UPI003AF40547
MPLTTLYNATYSTFNTYAQRPYDVIQVADTGSFMMMSSQCLTLGWLCCIASYDGLKIKKMENISSLLFWYL